MTLEYAHNPIVIIIRVKLEGNNRNLVVNQFDSWADALDSIEAVDRHQYQCWSVTNGEMAGTPILVLFPAPTMHPHYPHDQRNSA